MLCRSGYDITGNLYLYKAVYQIRSGKNLRIGSEFENNYQVQVLDIVSAHSANLVTFFRSVNGNGMQQRNIIKILRYTCSKVDGLPGTQYLQLIKMSKSR